MVKTYIFLVGAIFCEVAGTMLLPVSQNFTKLIPTVALSIFYLCAFYLLTFVVNKLPIAIVYATWSGLGIFTIAILGYIFFKQTLSWQAIFGLFLIVDKLFKILSLLETIGSKLIIFSIFILIQKRRDMYIESLQLKKFFNTPTNMVLI